MSDMSNLRERLVRAERALNNLASEGPSDAARLSGKAQGVALAISYLDEEQKTGAEGATT